MCLHFSLMAICVLEFASMYVHVCIEKCMFARMFPYAVERLLHLSVCMWTFMHSCASYALSSLTVCVCLNMSVSVYLPGF